MGKAITHSDTCKGLLLPTPIDGVVRLWCSGCGAIVGKDCSCGAVFSSEEEAHCAVCHQHFSSDTEFIDHIPPNAGGCVVPRPPKTAGRGIEQTPLGTVGASLLRELQNEAQKASRRTCSRGHPWTPENIYVHKNKARCRKCRRDNARKRRSQ